MRDVHNEAVQKYFLRQARELEKQRIQADRAANREAIKSAKDKSEKIVNVIESIFNNKVRMLKDQIEEEKYERRVAEQAQIQTLAGLQKEVRGEKAKELARYTELKRIEDINSGGAVAVAKRHK